jgi:hypothetical protein
MVVSGFGQELGRRYSSSSICSKDVGSREPPGIVDDFDTLGHGEANSLPKG